MVFRNFLHFTFWLTGPPQAGEQEIWFFLRHLGLGRPLARREIPGHFPVRGAVFGGKSGRPKSFFPKVRNFFTFCVLADRTPSTGNRRILFFRPFRPRTAPGRAAEQQGSWNGGKTYHAIRDGFSATFLGTNFFFGQTPTSRKRRFSGFLARFGIGRPLALN